MAEATVVKFCTHVSYVKCQHKNDKDDNRMTDCRLIGMVRVMWPVFS